jgi:hypothetical protein
MAPKLYSTCITRCKYIIRFYSLIPKLTFLNKDVDGGWVGVAGAAGVVALVPLGGGGEAEPTSRSRAVPLPPRLHPHPAPAVVVHHPRVVVPEDVGGGHRRVVCNVQQE